MYHLYLLQKKKKTKMKCSRCNLEKELVRGCWCRDCKNEYERQRIAKQSEQKKEERREKQRQRYLRNKEIAQNTIIIVDKTKEKECSICGQLKTEDQFHLNKT